jgi:hypothetical protein
VLNQLIQFLTAEYAQYEKELLKEYTKTLTDLAR